MRWIPDSVKGMHLVLSCLYLILLLSVGEGVCRISKAIILRNYATIAELIAFHSVGVALFGKDLIFSCVFFVLFFPTPFYFLVIYIPAFARTNGSGPPGRCFGTSHSQMVEMFQGQNEDVLFSNVGIIENVMSCCT